ncbi:MAG: DUF3619 family protein [Rhodoferax sp.]|nr:DUF3619 family protein [Rhodoferax sp.]
MNTPTQSLSFSNAAADAFGKAIALRLSNDSEALPHAVSERLKATRALAVAHRKITSTQQTAPAKAAAPVSVSGSVWAWQFGNHADGWLRRLAALLPLLVLLAGLVSIGLWQNEKRALEVAEVDVELLTDELPPQAFTDPGFAQFLRVHSAH